MPHFNPLTISTDRGRPPVKQPDIVEPSLVDCGRAKCRAAGPIESRTRQSPGATAQDQARRLPCPCCLAFAPSSNLNPFAINAPLSCTSSSTQASWLPSVSIRRVHRVVEQPGCYLRLGCALVISCCKQGGELRGRGRTPFDAEDLPLSF